MDQSFSLNINAQADESSDENDSCTNLSRDDALQKYNEWVVNQTKQNLKFMAVMIMNNFIDRFGLTTVGSAKETGLNARNQ